MEVQIISALHAAIRICFIVQLDVSLVALLKLLMILQYVMIVILNAVNVMGARVQIVLNVILCIIF